MCSSDLGLSGGKSARSWEGLVQNPKRTYRIYREEGLQVRTKQRKKLTRQRIPMAVPDGLNERWSIDFVWDQLANGRRFRVLNIVDDYSRECVLQIVDCSISGQRVARELNELERPLPNSLVCDNGPEFTSKARFSSTQETPCVTRCVAVGSCLLFSSLTTLTLSSSKLRKKALLHVRRSLQFLQLAITEPRSVQRFTLQRSKARMPISSHDRLLITLNMFSI